MMLRWYWRLHEANTGAGDGGGLTIEQQLQQLRQQNAEMRQRDLTRDIEMAQMRVYADHPHLRQYGLLEDFQGSPDQIVAFGKKLAEQFPPPAPQPAPLTQMPPTPAPPAPPTLPRPPENAGVPTPSPQEVLQQSTADAARADDIYARIRESMTSGRAMVSRADAQWFSHSAPFREIDLGNGLTGGSSGFVSAVKRLNKK